jgi:hypothetical protein
VEEKTQPSCDEKTLKLCSNNKLVPHRNKQGNKRGNFDKYATCEVELNVVLDVRLSTNLERALFSVEN